MGDPHRTTPFANVLDVGNCFVCGCFNMMRTHPSGGSLINFDLMALLFPAHLMGLASGAFVNVIAPKHLMFVLLLFLLCISIAVVLDKAIDMLRAEYKAEDERTGATLSQLDATGTISLNLYQLFSVYCINCE